MLVRFSSWPPALCKNLVSLYCLCVEFDCRVNIKPIEHAVVIGTAQSSSDPPIGFAFVLDDKIAILNVVVVESLVPFKIDRSHAASRCCGTSLSNVGSRRVTHLVMDGEE